MPSTQFKVKLLSLKWMVGGKFDMSNTNEIIISLFS